MHINHSKAGLYMTFTKEEYNQITHNGEQRSVHVLLVPTSVQRFMQISRTPLQGSVQRSIYEMKRKFGEYQLQLAPNVRGVKQLPMFAPEPVAITVSNTHAGPLFDIARPPMTRAPNAGKSMPTRKKDKEPAQEVNSAGLPFVPPSPDKEVLTQAASTIGLRTAVDVINKAVEESNGEMRLEVTPKGRLVVMMIYGGDSND